MHPDRGGKLQVICFVERIGVADRNQPPVELGGDRCVGVEYVGAFRGVNGETAGTHPDRAALEIVVTQDYPVPRRKAPSQLAAKSGLLIVEAERILEIDRRSAIRAGQRRGRIEVTQKRAQPDADCFLAKTHGLGLCARHQQHDCKAGRLKKASRIDHVHDSPDYAPQLCSGPKKCTAYKWFFPFRSRRRSARKRRVRPIFLPPCDCRLALYRAISSLPDRSPAVCPAAPGPYESVRAKKPVRVALCPPVPAAAPMHHAVP